MKTEEKVKSTQTCFQEINFDFNFSQYFRSYRFYNTEIIIFGISKGCPGDSQ